MQDFTTTQLNRVRRVRANAVEHNDIIGLATLIMGLPIIPVPTSICDTMATDGKNVYVNPEFVSTLSDKGILGILLHEALHIANLHHIRRNPDWDVKDWNVATDFVSNHSLLGLEKKGIIEITRYGALVHPDFDDAWSAEKVYREITANKPELQDVDSPISFGDEDDEGEDEDGEDGDGDGDQQSEGGQQGQGQDDSGENDTEDEGSSSGSSGGNISSTGGQNTQNAHDQPNLKRQLPKGYNVPGEVWDAPPDVDPVEEKERIIDAIADSLLLEKAVGTGAGSALAKIQEGMGKSESWDILREYLQRRWALEHTWNQPNRRYIHRELYLPGKRKETDVLHIAIDTSGSMGRQEIMYCLENTRGIAEQIGLNKLKIAFVDTKVHLNEFGEPWQEIDVAGGGEIYFEYKGGGGTTFDPIFHLIEETDEEVNALVYMTDGWGSVTISEPPYPVVWFCTSKIPWWSGEARDGWGEIIDVSKLRHGW